MASQSRSDKQSLPWTLSTDESGQAHEPDEFGHVRYSDALTELIESSTAGSAIGLFGGYGTGKTWVIRELETRLDQLAPRYGFVEYDAWRYADDEIRRDLLVTLKNQMETRGYLKEKIEWNADVFKVDLQNEKEEAATYDWKAFRKAARDSIWLGVGYIIAGVLGGLSLGWATVGFPEAWAFVSGGIVTGLSWAGNVAHSLIDVNRLSVKNVTVSTRRRVEYPEEFSEKFLSLIQARNTDRLIVVIDNLDRCSPTVALRVLSTIKNFLEPADSDVYFVIPCDYDALLRHLTSNSASLTSLPDNDLSDAREYLGKFFSSSISIAPFAGGELREAARSALSRVRIAQELSDADSMTLAQIAASATRSSPRELKLFLNQVSTRTLVHRQGVTDGDPLSVLDIAKLAAIDKEAPELATLLRRDPALLAEAENQVRGTAQEPDPRVHSALSEESAEHIIRALLWHELTTAAVSTYIGLRLPPESRGISSYFEYLAALQDADLESAIKIANETPKERITDLIAITVETIRRESEALPGAAVNARAVAVGLVGGIELTTRQRRELIEEAASLQYLSRAMSIAGMEQLNKALLKSSEDPRARRLVSGGAAEWFEDVNPEIRRTLLAQLRPAIDAIDELGIDSLSATIEQTIRKDRTFISSLDDYDVTQRRKLLTSGVLDFLTGLFELPTEAANTPDADAALAVLEQQHELLGPGHLAHVTNQTSNYLQLRRDAELECDGPEEGLILGVVALAAAISGDGVDVLADELQRLADSTNPANLIELAAISPDLEAHLGGRALAVLQQNLVRTAVGETPVPVNEALSSLETAAKLYSTRGKESLLQEIAAALSGHDGDRLAVVALSLAREAGQWGTLAESAALRAAAAPERFAWLRAALLDTDQEEREALYQTSVEPLVGHLAEASTFSAAAGELNELTALWTEQQRMLICENSLPHLGSAAGELADQIAELVSKALNASVKETSTYPELLNAVESSVVDSAFGLDSPDHLYRLQLDLTGDMNPTQQLRVRGKVQERLRQFEISPERSLAFSQQLVDSTSSHVEALVGPIAEFAL